jgi:tetratricopeptide (TPR) repeat protein
MSKPLPVTAVLLLSVLGMPALALDKSGEESSGAKQGSRESRERDARRACLNGDYTAGVALLSELFLDFKNPTYIFNQGRCYEQNQRFEEAIARFREYLRTGGRDSAVAEQHIAECEALQKKNSPAPAPVAQAPTLASALPVVQPGPVAEAKQQPALPAAPGSGLRIAGAVAAGVGVAGLVAGIVFNLKANSLADSIDPPNHMFNRDTESTRGSYETYSWVGYGIGAAGLVAGVVLYGVGWTRAGSTPEVALLPTFGPGLAGAAVKGVF